MLPGPDETLLIRAQPNMADALTTVAWEAKGSWGYPEEWMEEWRGELTVKPSDLDRHEAWVAIESSEPVGFFVLLREDDHLGNLDHLWVRPDHMGMGIGRLLFRHAIDRAAQLGITTVSIEADPNAEAFYLRHGARRIGTSVRSVCGFRRELPLLTISPG